MLYIKNYIEGGVRIRTPEVLVWNAVKHRCLIGGSKQKANPSYIGCTMSKNFQDFQYFASWCNKQLGFNKYDTNNNKWNLDKDIIVKGNKKYTEITCVFVPQEINKFFTTRKAKRGLYPIGVYATNNIFKAQCGNNSGVQICLGSFATPELAFYAYKKFKEN